MQNDTAHFTKPPRPQDIHEAVNCLLEDVPVGDRYIAALIDLVEGEYVRRIRARRRASRRS